MARSTGAGQPPHCPSPPHSLTGALALGAAPHALLNLAPGRLPFQCDPGRGGRSRATRRAAVRRRGRLAGARSELPHCSRLPPGDGAARARPRVSVARAHRKFQGVQEFNPFKNSKFGPFGHPNGPNKRLPYRAARCRPLFGSFKIQNSNFARGLKFKGLEIRAAARCEFRTFKVSTRAHRCAKYEFRTILCFIFRILDGCCRTTDQPRPRGA